MKTLAAEALEREALRSALAPFAEAAQRYLYGFPSRQRMGDEDELAVTVKLGDLRRAVKVMHETQ